MSFPWFPLQRWPTTRGCAISSSVTPSRKTDLQRLFTGIRKKNTHWPPQSPQAINEEKSWLRISTRAVLKSEARMPGSGMFNINSDPSSFIQLWNYQVFLATLSPQIQSTLCLVAESPTLEVSHSASCWQRVIGRSCLGHCVWSCVMLSEAVSQCQLKQPESLLLRSPTVADFD